ncbi:MAG: peptidoglycan DD-metalloendopeptidase family protein [Chromatiales bacterium]|nr:peptidoglycan DD-metalloendopeptidase family protein [Chromatiales bacterium]
MLPAVLLLAACSGAVRWEEPGARGTAPASSRAGQPDAASRPEWHTVRAGETLYSIASRYGLGASQLAAWNELGDGTLIRVGQRLRLSPSGGAPPAASRPVAPVASEAPPRWQWPVNGPVLARYGESPLTASGIQLGGRSGDAIRAAAGGQVVYAGSGLTGYGELLIIKHSPSWLTAYGYNQALMVREGDRVEAGQPIARMGEGPGISGASRRPALHFEIRRNGTPLDPLTELPRVP